MYANFSGMKNKSRAKQIRKNENKPIIKYKLTPEINTVAIQLPIKSID